jgi:FkbM family methyltransferase
MTIESFKVAQNKFGYYCVPLSSSYTLTSKQILKGKVHEPSTIDFIIKNSAHGDVVHAGAGFGDFLPALSNSNISKIWAFEPNSLNFQCAEETIKLNSLKNIQLFPYALGAENCIGKIKIKEDDQALGVRSYIDSDLANLNNTDSEIVTIKTLDSAIPNERKISLIHLDTEGYEEAIISGAKKIIEKDAPLIILEIHSEALRYNRFMHRINYLPVKHLIYNAGPMIFINTVYKKCGQ